jgi:hypothetical protein
MTGEELAAWRLAQPGEFKARNGQTVKGWSQKKAADWYGCGERTWRRWESSDEIPRKVAKAIVRYSSSLKSELDRIMA